MHHPPRLIPRLGMMCRRGSGVGSGVSGLQSAARAPASAARIAPIRSCTRSRSIDATTRLAEALSDTPCTEQRRYVRECAAVCYLLKLRENSVKNKYFRYFRIWANGPFMPDVASGHHGSPACVAFVKQSSGRITIARERSVIRRMRTDELDFHLPPELIARSRRPSDRIRDCCTTKGATAALHIEGSRTFRNCCAAATCWSLTTPASFRHGSRLRKDTGGRIEGLYSPKNVREHGVSS